MMKTVYLAFSATRTVALAAFISLSTIPLAVAQTIGTPDMAFPPVISTINVASDEPIDNESHPLSTGTTFHFHWSESRKYGFGDLRGTGLNDIVYGATWFNRQPRMPLQIWANLGNGKFEDQTSQLIAPGDIPLVGSLNNIFVHDFDNDGRADIFIVDQGLEDLNLTIGFTGGTNILLKWGPDGKLHDRSSELPDNGFHFNHLSSMADVNGDGNMDIVLTRLGGTKFGGGNFSGGILFLFSDGKGGFTKSTAGIPAGVRHPTDFSTDWQAPGSASVCDVNGDGRGDLIGASYGREKDGGRWVRINQQLPDGNFVEKAKIAIPAAIADVPYGEPPDTRGLGAFQIVCGRLNNDMRTDVLVSWEGNGKSYVQILRNDGNFQFTDITLTALSSYKTTYEPASGLKFPINRTTIEDFNGDGYEDIIFYSYSVKPESLTGLPVFINLNDGNGVFSPWRISSGGKLLTNAEVLEGLAAPDFYSYFGLVFDAGGSAHKDVVLINGQRELTAGPRIRSLSVDIRTIFNTAPLKPQLKTGAIFSTAQDSSRSYIRLNNTGTTAGTATVNLADASTGKAFASWTSPTIPAGASAQHFVQELESFVAPTVTRPQYFSMSVRPAFDGSFQHVLWRPSDGTLTNLSTCAGAVTANAARLINVHSTVLGTAYPSSVVISNTGTGASAAQLGIYDSTTGAKLGTYTSAVIAQNNQVIVSVADIEAAAAINPGTTIYHYNIIIENAFTGFLQHLVNNAQVGVITDMTTVCSLGTVAASTTPTQLRQGALFSTAQPSSRSYVRFHNTGTTPGTVTVTLTDASTAQTYATWTSPTIPAGASVQHFVQELESASTTGAARPQFFAVSTRSTFDGYMQHVLWRPADGTLTNLSTCNAGVTANATQLINVHSSLLESDYPSSVVVANTDTAASSVQLGVYNSNTGVKLGTYTTPSIPVNGQAIIGISTLQAATNINPGTTIFHYNIKIESAFTGFLQHLVTNKQAGVITDMTASCQIAKN